MNMQKKQLFATVFHFLDKQKSGTAILLFRYLRLWYCLYIRTNNTEAHAVCTNVRIMRVH